MPIDAIDKQPQDITGDPKAAQPLNPKKMQGAMKQQINRTQLGVQPKPSPERPSAGGGDAQTQGQPEDQAKPEAKPAEAPVTQPPQGIGPAWDALTGGIGEILKDPAWTEHPLLHVFQQAATDPGKDPSQTLWEATQWWGRVINAAFDPNAIHASAASLEHDNGVSGLIAQRLFGIHNDQASEFAWNVIPYALTMMAEFPPWMWGPAVAAGGPGQVSNVPQAAMALFGNDLKHPQFAHPDWYARMGSYVLAAAITAKGSSKAAGPLIKFTGRLKALEPFAEHADRMLGGPGEKTPIKGPDGAMYDPIKDPQGHAHATWWNDNLAPVEERSTPIGKAAEQPADRLIAHPEIDNAYQVAKADPQAKPKLALMLGMRPDATEAELRDQFFAMAEHREISPQLSAKIEKEWDRFGPVVGQMGKLHYWHAGEAPYRNVLDSLGRIEDTAKHEQAFSAMRMANGFRGDLWKGVHGFGNDLSEAMVKGVLSHGRSTPYYVTKMAASVREVVPTAAERARVSKAIEAANTEGGQAFADSLYSSLTPHEKWAVDFYRRIVGEVRAAKFAHGRQLEAQPNFFYRVPKRIANLEAILKGIPEKIRTEARASRGRSPFGYASKEHRAFKLTTDAEGEVRAEPAYATTEDANIQRGRWREQIKADLLKRAEKDPDLAKITADPTKLDALAYAEIPDFSTDMLDSLLGSGNHGMVPDVNALYTHQVMETAKRTLVRHDKDGRWHPLAVARSESGQESSPTLGEHFKELHGADTTTDYYRSEGWKSIDGFGSGHVFHSSLANPLNTAIRFGKGDSDAAMRALKKISGAGKKMIMLNPAWHSGNMMGRFMMLAGAHPSGVFNTILKARGMKELNPEQAREWWDLQEHEAMEHGLLPPQLNEDVVNSAGKYHALSTGDVETGAPHDVKAPVAGFHPSAADALNAVKGVDAWWQNTVNSLMWSKIHDFSVLSYIVLKDDAVHRGMAPGDARLMASSQANSFGGMVSPDRWMNNPAMHDLSQLLLFAPNWWRTFPRILLNSYDRMGMKSNPALTHAWALNSAKTIGAMILLKGATDNLLNYAMSGHWQFQNPDGYKNQVTMDRFFQTDPTTGAHHVMEDPFFRQPNDLEKVLGIFEPMRHGDWHPDFHSAGQGAAEVLAARASPLVQALETASNWDLYNTIKSRSMRWVDPQHPGFLQSGQAAAAGALNFAPFGPSYMAQAGLQGATAQPQTLDWGPFQGTQIPGWAARAFNPNEPLAAVLGWLGVRGGYPAPVKSGERGLSSEDQAKVHKYSEDWNNYLTKQNQAVMGGGMTWSDFAYHYKQQAATYFNQVRGATDGTSHYMQGADGLLSQYESFYNDKEAFDVNGDINWAYVQRQQDQLQAKTDPATWRQMAALKDKREMQFPVLRAYKDSLHNYRNFQDTQAKAMNMDGETLRGLIAQGASVPDFRRFEAAHPELAHYYAAKRTWEMNTKQGFAYGLFTNNQYVMRVVSPGGDPKQVAAAEQKILPQIEAAEKAGSFVTPTGQ